MYSLKKKIGFITTVGLIFIIFGCAPQVHEHTFGEWEITKEATEESEGSKKQVCSVCKYEKIETIDKLEHTHKFSDELTYNETKHWYAATCEHTDEKKDLAEHTFGEWEIAKEATEESEGSKKQVCSVCKYEKTETIDKLEHTHKFSDELTYDETNHWYAATCEHTDEKKDLAVHTFGEWEIKDEITLNRVCAECNFKEESINIESLKATNLPIVEINTVDNIAITSKEDWLEATFNLTGDYCAEENLSINTEIKGRGNSSWVQPKKSYSLKLESKEKILGMKKHKRWVLIANYSDKTLLRNYLASQMGNNIFNKVWNPSFKSVHLILNGKYNGVYLLGEQIKIDKNRVNIQAIDEIEEDINGDSFIDINDGGFICEVNERMDELFNFRTTKGVAFSLKEPDEVPSEVQETIKEIVQKAEDVLYGENWLDETNGYRKYFDVDSFIDWYIINELTKNNDAIFFSSVYLYYNPKDKLLHMGPNWDFDISCGNINYNGCDNTQGYYIANAKWISRLFEDESFKAKLKERWDQKKEELRTFITTTIQSNADNISEAAKLNFIKWNILGTYVWPNPDGYEQRTTYQSEIDLLIDFLTKRFYFLDAEFSK